MWSPATILCLTGFILCIAVQISYQGKVLPGYTVIRLLLDQIWFLAIFLFGGALAAAAVSIKRGSDYWS